MKSTFTSRIKWFNLGFFALIFAIGCKSENQRLNEQYGEVTVAKLELVNRCLELAATLPEPTDSYEKWVANRRQVEMLRSFFESESRKKAEDDEDDLLTPAMASVESAYAEVRLEPPTPIVFGRTDGTAGTLMLSVDNHDPLSNDFQDRNQNASSWYFFDPGNAEAKEALQWYQFIENLEYLLILRQHEIELPEFVERKDSGSSTYMIGGMVCDAFLIRLEDQSVVGSFRFNAPNDRGLARYLGFDFSLGSDPEQGIKTLTLRLYETAHRFSRAVSAELSDKISYEEMIVRDLLGARLEKSPSAK